MNLLDQLLEKRKIKLDELDDQERSTYDSIKKELETEITTDTIKKFCESELSVLQNQWLDMDGKGLTDLTIRKEELIIKARMQNYRSIIKLFWKTENIKKHGKKRIKDILKN